jgi:hypothetical protein
MIASAVLIVLLMMGAESTRNMYSNLAVNKYNRLKLHHVGYLIKQFDGARNHKYKISSCTSSQLVSVCFNARFAPLP